VGTFHSPLSTIFYGIHGLVAPVIDHDGNF